MTPSEDKPDLESILDQYIYANIGLIVGGSDNLPMDKGECKYMMRQMYKDYVEPLCLKLKEKEQEIEKLKSGVIYLEQYHTRTSIEHGQVYISQLEKISKLEQSNNDLKEMLYECIGYFEHNYASTVKIKEIKQLIQSEGTTKKE